MVGRFVRRPVRSNTPLFSTSGNWEHQQDAEGRSAPHRGEPALRTCTNSIPRFNCLFVLSVSTVNFF